MNKYLTVDVIKQRVKENPRLMQVINKFKNGNVDKMNDHDLSHLTDTCVSTTINTAKGAEPLCNQQLYEVSKVFYNYKFFGSRIRKDQIAIGSTFARRFLKILEAFRSNPEHYATKLHAICKSDTTVGPFYVLLGLIAPQKEYIEEFKKATRNNTIPHRPVFADNLITEIYEKNGQYYIQLIRNGIPQNTCNTTDKECKLDDFIKFVKSRMMSKVQ